MTDQVLKTWQEIADYLRKSISWAKDAAKTDGLPVLRSIGPNPPRNVWTTTTLLNVWLSKKMQEQKKLDT